MSERGDRLHNQAPRTEGYSIDVLLKGGPLSDQHRNIGHAEPPRFLAAIPGGDGQGIVMKPPMDPPPTVGAYELTEHRDALGAYVYDWRSAGTPFQS
jgi:hypothetical protein